VDRARGTSRRISLRTSGWALRRHGVALLALAALCACAHRQTIPVDCVPEEVKIYVDGRLLDEIPEELTLRADEDHTLYFKGEGYRPELVVLRTDGADTPKLTPDTLCVKPVLRGMDREVEMEIDPD
jgi:hypothetical protein